MLVFDIISLLQCLQPTQMHYNRISRLDTVTFDVLNIPNVDDLARNSQLEVIKWKKPTENKSYTIAAMIGDLKLLKYLVSMYPYDIQQIIRCAMIYGRTNILTWLEDKHQFVIGDVNSCKQSIKMMKWILRLFPNAINTEVVISSFHSAVGPWLVRNNPQYNFETIGYYMGGKVVIQWLAMGGNINEIMAFIGVGIINVDTMLKDFALPLLDRIQEPICTTRGINNAILDGHFKAATWARKLGNHE